MKTHLGVRLGQAQRSQILVAKRLHLRHQLHVDERVDALHELQELREACGQLSVDAAQHVRQVAHALKADQGLVTVQNGFHDESNARVVGDLRERGGEGLGRLLRDGDASALDLARTEVLFLTLMGIEHLVVLRILVQNHRWIPSRHFLVQELSLVGIQRGKKQCEGRNRAVGSGFGLRVVVVDSPNPLFDLSIHLLHFLLLLVVLVVVAIRAQSLISENVLFIRFAQRRDALRKQSAKLEVVLAQEG